MTKKESTQLAKINTAAIAESTGLNQDFVDLVKDTVAVGATDNELRLFLETCKKVQLNPLNKEVFFWKQFSKQHGREIPIIHTGIRGYRKAAERTGCYRPGKPVVYEMAKGNKNPIAATAHVMKLVAGEWFEVTFRAEWAVFARGTAQWRGQYGKHQLGITAERHALQRAFPILEEMVETPPEGEPAEEVPAMISQEELQIRAQYTAEIERLSEFVLDEAELNALEGRISSLETPELIALQEKVHGQMCELIEAQANLNGIDFESFRTANFPEGMPAANTYHLADVYELMLAPAEPDQLPPAEPEDADFVHDAEMFDLRSAVKHKAADVYGEQAETHLPAKIIDKATEDQLSAWLSELNAGGLEFQCGSCEVVTESYECKNPNCGGGDNANN